jgi:hypothetical protein
MKIMGPEVPFAYVSEVALDQRERIYYVFLHPTFGPIMFLPLFLCMRLSELKFLMLSAMCLFPNGMTFRIACFTGIL